jgi:hypothetical protein
MDGTHEQRTERNVRQEALIAIVPFQNSQQSEALSLETQSLSSGANNSSYGRNASTASANCLSIISARTGLRGVIEHWNGSGPVNIPCTSEENVTLDISIKTWIDECYFVVCPQIDRNGLLGLWIDCMVEVESPDKVHHIKHLQPMYE